MYLYLTIFADQLWEAGWHNLQRTKILVVAHAHAGLLRSFLIQILMISNVYKLYKRD